jgi:selenocysteine lyase/cysteine desulfurase
MIYLDNASTTHKKPLSVVFSVIKAMTLDSVNPGRSGYKLSISAENKILDTRVLFKEYFNLKSIEDVIFTSGATMSINLALIGTKRLGGHIVATMYEHNSVLRCLDYLKTNYNITYTLVAPRADGVIYKDDIEASIKPNTYLVVTNYTSNVVGFDLDVSAIGKMAKKHNLIYMVDGAQAVGHKKIDMQKCNINLLAIAGHKGLYAPQGIGVLLIKDVKVLPLIMGGTGTYSDSVTQPTELPEGLESGTRNLPGIYGLNAGIKYVYKNMDKIQQKLNLYKRKRQKRKWDEKKLSK